LETVAAMANVPAETPFGATAMERSFMLAMMEVFTALSSDEKRI